ncbi:MAG TPA: TROVE domain-containing protein [Candidatus Angelobacter sp.]|jgi:hypothetical protein|nr:TROVE domain-containing protein [Candidatus Angelobacter sp.]
MSRTNMPASHPPELNHEGTRVARLRPEQTLRRLCMSTLLWEDGFYVDGKSHAELIREVLPLVQSHVVAEIAIEARSKQKLRHLPLFLVRELARKADGTIGPNRFYSIATVLQSVIQRPDELAEFLAIYWKDVNRVKEPISAQVKKGLALAFQKFDEYALAKYNRDGAIKLRDVMFLVHPKPKDAEQAAVWKRLASGELEVPITWETQLSAGEKKTEPEKKVIWESLIQENKLGALAVMRNLRNMQEAGVDEAMIKGAIRTMKTERVLPFRFIAAARHNPWLEPELEQAMLKCLASAEKLPGKTALVIDTSPSMWGERVSSNSEMDRFEAAAALAILAREVCEAVSIYAFNQTAHIVPARSGFALRDALARTKGNASFGGLAVELANSHGYDRIIVLTDGEWHHGSTQGNALLVSPPPLTEKAYMVNVANTRNGVGYGKWISVDGWSEAIIDFIRECESVPLQ